MKKLTLKKLSDNLSILQTDGPNDIEIKAIR
jgi:hypothetical protein